jgi:hypothetical protein
MQRTFRCDPIQPSQWKRQLLDGSSELFTRSKQTKDNKVAQAKEAELFHQIGRLQLELASLKKFSAVLLSVNYASWSITNTPKSASAGNVPCWAWLDRRYTTGPYRCGNRRCGS